MLRAARSGIINFREARTRDVRWWRYVNVVLNELQRHDEEPLLLAAYQFHLALVANSSLTSDSWNKAKKDALDLYNELINLRHPWGSKKGEQRQAEQLNTLAELYRKEIGDPNDPLFKKQLEEAEAFLKQAPPPQEEDVQSQIYKRSQAKPKIWRPTRRQGR